MVKNNVFIQIIQAMPPDSSEEGTLMEGTEHFSGTTNRFLITQKRQSLKRKKKEYSLAFQLRAHW